MFNLITPIAATLAVVTAASDSINGNVSETVSITLDSNPTTGYRWMIQEIPSELLFIDTTMISTYCAVGQTGCPQKAVLNFYANSAGDGTLKLVYGRSWSKDDWKEKDVSVHIE